MKGTGAIATLAFALALAVPATGQPATTQTFTTSQSPFPPDGFGVGGPNQGVYDWGCGAGCIWPLRGPYFVWRGRIGANNFFTFDLGSSCEASAATLQVVRGSESGMGTLGTADYSMHEVTTPAAIVNTPGGSPWSWQTAFTNFIPVFDDLEDGPTYGGGSYPISGSPSDILHFPLNAVGVAALNAARESFFTIGGTGGGRTDFNPIVQSSTRNHIFDGVRDPARLVVTCALPTSTSECKNGGWRDFGVFKNQGDCVSFVASGGKNPPAGH